MPAPLSLPALRRCAAAALACLLAACGGGNGARTQVPATTLSSAYSRVVWEDDFANDPAGAPDATRWAGLTGNGTEYGNPGWGNNELEYYLPQNAAVTADGVLALTGRADPSLAATLPAGTLCAGAPCGFSSARLTSLRTVDLSRPGLLEIKAQLPTAVGGWPAIWLLPGQSPGAAFPPAADQLALQPDWPAGGEIDMAEWLGRYFAGNRFVVQSTLHLPGGDAAPYVDSYAYKAATGLTEPVDTSFHVYQLSWTTDRLTFSLDDQAVMTCAQATQTCSPVDGQNLVAPVHWPFGTTFHDYYLILNLAIGGNLGAPNGDNRAVPADFDSALNVAYVRYMVP